MANETDLAHIPLNGSNKTHATSTSGEHRPDAGDHDNDDTAVATIDATGDSVAFKLGANNGAVRIVRANAPASKDGRCAAAGDDSAAEATVEPPDGGTRGWLIMLSAFLCNSILFGIINTYGSIYVELQRQLSEAADGSASGKAALVGSLTIGTTFLLSTLAGILTDQIGVRNTTLLGGLLAAGGMFLSALFVNSITALCFTYGIMFGLGAALAYTPSLSILGHYFKRYLGVVNGFVTAGSSVSTALLPFFLDYMIHQYNLRITFFVLGLFSLSIIACSLTYKPLRPMRSQAKPAASSAASASSVEKTGGPRRRTVALLRSLVYVENWRKPRYVIWAFSIPVALIGYFVPYVHTPKLVLINFPGVNEKAPIMCISITSGIGRLVCGYLADLKGINRIYLQQFSFVAIGLLTMVIPLTDSYYVLLAICTLMGLFDGCFISLLGPVAHSICGTQGATQGIGFLLGLCSIPLTVGPPIAGMLYDQTSSYTLSYVLAGIPPLIGSAMMCMMRYVGDDDGHGDGRGDAEKARGGSDDEQAQEPLARPAWIDENVASIKITSNGHNGHANGLYPVLTNGDQNGTAPSTAESQNDHVDRH